MARESFKFRLQRLLDVRIMREKQAQQELQVRRQQVVIEKQRLVDMKNHESDLRTQQREPFHRGDDLYEFQMRRYFLEQAINENLKEQTQQETTIQKAEDAVLKQQDVVRQRGIDVKALEKLREKQLSEHSVEQLRKEGLFLDDLAGQGFLRKQKHEHIN